MKLEPFTLGLQGLLAMLLLVLALPTWSAAGLVADPLVREAMTSPLAVRSVLTAITRSGNRLIAVGERGHILLSDDAGKSWRQAKVPVSVTLTAVTFVDERSGWACGHGSVILHSDDGGVTWTKQLDGRQAGGILRAAAGGMAPSGAAAGIGEDQSDKPLLDIHFQDADNGLAIGAYGLVLVTSDGGRSWQPGLDRLPNPEGKHLYALRRVGQELAIVGEQGALFLSRDAGRSFVPVGTPYKGSFFDLVALAPQSFLVVGLRGSVYRTVDDGASWAKVDVPTKDAVTAGRVLADGTVLLVDGAGNVWVSVDRGMSFGGHALNHPFPLSGVAQASDGDLAVVGARGVEVLPLSRLIKAGQR
jgi:photosystem II stability/assembly factor-like uncharacterized protein